MHLSSRLTLCLMASIVLGAGPQTGDAPASPTVEALRSKPEAERNRAETDLWEELRARGTPLVEAVAGDTQRSLVTFFWRSDQELNNVAVITPISLSDFPASALQRIPGTHTWFRTYLLPNDARFSYRFAENDSGVPFEQERDFMKRMQTWRLDTMNPARTPLAPGIEASVLQLSGAPSAQWSQRRDDVPHGALREVTIPIGSKAIPRRAWLYSPPGAASGEHRALIVFLDGESYTTVIPAPVILDNLIAAHKIRPAAALFLASSDARESEYSCNAGFSDQLAGEVLAYGRKELHAGATPPDTILAGFSLGGLQAACTAVLHPERIGAVLAQSGSFYRAPSGEEPEALSRLLAASPPRPLRWYFEIGLLEKGAIPSRDPSMLTASRHLRDVLSAKGTPHRFREYFGGHEHVAWRQSLAMGLEYLLPR